MSQSDETRTPEKARQAESNDRYLAFQIGKEQYAIPLLQVKEVIQMSEPMPVPQAPAYFKGLINLRGQVISVIDLRSKLQFPSVENGPKTAIIILDLDGVLSFGVVVDRINSVLAFSSEDKSAAPDLLSGKQHYLTGIARRGEKMTLILDIHAALGLNDVELIRKNSAKKVS